MRAAIAVSGRMADEETWRPLLYQLCAFSRLL